MYKRLLVILPLIASPGLALAAPKTFKELINKLLLPIIDQSTKILIALGVVIFFWNIATSLFGERSSEKTQKLRDAIVWGIIIIFVMVSIWGILYIFRLTLMRGL